MTSLWSPNWRSCLQWLGLGIVTLILYVSVKNFLLLDPFARWRSALQVPFSEAVSAVMENVDVTVYQRTRLVLSFSARRVIHYRQDNRLELMGINEGKLSTQGGSPVFFQAELASYVPSESWVRVAGSPRAWTSDWELTAEVVDLYETQKRLRASGGVRGKYHNGNLKAKILEISYEKGGAYAKDVVWNGFLTSFQQSPGATQEKKPARVSAGVAQYLSNPRRQIILNGELSTEDWILRADQVERNLETGMIRAVGRCEYRGRDAVLTAPLVIVSEKDERAELTGGVNLLIKPQEEKDDPKKGEPLRFPGQAGPSREADRQKEQEEWEKRLRDPETLRQYPIVVTCEKAEYFYREGARRAVLQGSVKARQDLTEGVWREMRAPSAVYLEDEELLIFKGSVGKKEVRMINSIGDDLIAEEVTIYTVQGNETLTAKNPEGILMLPKEQKTPPPTQRVGRIGELLGHLNASFFADQCTRQHQRR
ncbi:MAG: hypothetical protein QXI19_04090 [Candidatus Caldarchaeum sp.]